MYPAKATGFEPAVGYEATHLAVKEYLPEVDPVCIWAAEWFSEKWLAYLCPTPYKNLNAK